MNIPTTVSRASMISAGITLALAASLPASAQTSTGAPSLREEVVVTARKVEETLQTVPVAVTAFSEEAIRRQRIEGIADIALYTPGLVYQDINGTLSLPVIRGLAQTNINSDNNVGMFMNGIYLSNNRTLDIGLVDLERVEVIKGPQSALYGQNSFAGAINYITAKPTDSFEAEIGGGFGSDELYEVNGNVSGPITDSLSGQFSFAYKEFDGTFENQNPASSDNLQGYESTGFSGTLEFAPSERFQARLFGYYVDLENEIPAQYLVANNCGVSAFGSSTSYCGELPADGTFDLSEGVFGRVAENTIVSLDIDWEFAPNWWVRSITAQVDSESSSYFDFDYTSTGVPFGTVDVVTGTPGTALINTYLGQGQTEVTDFSQEFRIEYTGERFEAMIGAFYYDSDRSNDSLGAVDISPLGPTERLTSFLGFIFGTTDPLSPIDSNQTDETAETTALFGRVGWQATDKLRLSAELRWAEEDKTIDRILQFTFPVTNNAQQSASFDAVTPRITVDYQLTDDILLYGVYAKGARSGGFNSASTIPEEDSYDQEENDTYELGIKSQWMEQRLTLNAAVYQIDWTDLQISSISQDPNNIAAIIRNTGEAESSGIELEGSFLISDNFLIGGTYSYSDPKFKSGAVDLGLTGPCGVDNSICPNGTNVGGQQLGRTVKTMWSAYVAANGQLTGGWNWFARADLAYKDDQFINASNIGFIGEYTLLNARVGAENDRFEVALWSKNLTDEEYLTASSFQPRFHTGATNDVTFGYGRIVGLSALMRFGQ
jgi:iron complex outermembrane receptor protein